MKLEITQSDLDRFWSKVEKTSGCWLWTGGADRKGYGKFSHGPARNADGKRRNSMVSAHRFSFEAHNGVIPEAGGFHGNCVLHECDNPRCVNPAHLFLGTNAENVADMDRKGRRITSVPKGSDHANAVLNESTVLEIARRYEVGDVTQQQLSIEYGVSVATINHIFTGRLWGHLGISVNVSAIKRSQAAARMRAIWAARKGSKK